MNTVPKLSQRIRGCGLYPGHAFQFRTGRHAGTQQHKRCGGTDQNGIDKYGQHLNQPLFDRVGNCSACRCVGSGTDAGFIGKQASFDAVHNAGAGKSSEDRPEVKCIIEKMLREHSRNQAGNASAMMNRDTSKVKDTHNRNKHFRNL